METLTSQKALSSVPAKEDDEARQKVKKSEEHSKKRKGKSTSGSQQKKQKMSQDKVAHVKEQIPKKRASGAKSAPHTVTLAPLDEETTEEDTTKIRVKTKKSALQKSRHGDQAYVETTEKSNESHMSVDALVRKSGKQKTKTTKKAVRKQQVEEQIAAKNADETTELFSGVQDAKLKSSRVMDLQDKMLKVTVDDGEGNNSSSEDNAAAGTQSVAEKSKKSKRKKHRKNKKHRKAKAAEDEMDNTKTMRKYNVGVTGSKNMIVEQMSKTGQKKSISSHKEDLSKGRDDTGDQTEIKGDASVEEPRQIQDRFEGIHGGPDVEESVKSPISDRGSGGTLLKVVHKLHVQKAQEAKNLDTGMSGVQQTASSGTFEIDDKELVSGDDPQKCIEIEGQREEDVLKKKDETVQKKLAIDKDSGKHIVTKTSDQIDEDVLKSREEVQKQERSISEGDDPGQETDIGRGVHEDKEVLKRGDEIVQKQGVIDKELKDNCEQTDSMKMENAKDIDEHVEITERNDSKQKPNQVTTSGKEDDDGETIKKDNSATDAEKMKDRRDVDEQVGFTESNGREDESKQVSITSKKDDDAKRIETKNSAINAEKMKDRGDVDEQVCVTESNDTKQESKQVTTSGKDDDGKGTEMRATPIDAEKQNLGACKESHKTRQQKIWVHKRSHTTSGSQRMRQEKSSVQRRLRSTSEGGHISRHARMMSVTRPKRKGVARLSKSPQGSLKSSKSEGLQRSSDGGIGDKQSESGGCSKNTNKEKCSQDTDLQKTSETEEVDVVGMDKMKQSGKPDTQTKMDSEMKIDTSKEKSDGNTPNPLSVNKLSTSLEMNFDPKEPALNLLDLSSESSEGGSWRASNDSSSSSLMEEDTIQKNLEILNAPSSSSSDDDDVGHQSTPGSTKKDVFLVRQYNLKNTESGVSLFCDEVLPAGDSPLEAQESANTPPEGQQIHRDEVKEPENIDPEGNVEDPSVHHEMEDGLQEMASPVSSHNSSYTPRRLSFEDMAHEDRQQLEDREHEDCQQEEDKEGTTEDNPSQDGVNQKYEQDKKELGILKSDVEVDQSEAATKYKVANKPASTERRADRTDEGSIAKQSQDSEVGKTDDFGHPDKVSSGLKEADDVPKSHTSPHEDGVPNRRLCHHEGSQDPLSCLSSQVDTSGMCDKERKSVTSLKLTASHSQDKSLSSTIEKEEKEQPNLTYLNPRASNSKEENPVSVIDLGEKEQQNVKSQSQMEPCLSDEEGQLESSAKPRASYSNEENPCSAEEEKTEQQNVISQSKMESSLSEDDAHSTYPQAKKELPTPSKLCEEVDAARGVSDDKGASKSTPSPIGSPHLSENSINCMSDDKERPTSTSTPKGVHARTQQSENVDKKGTGDEKDVPDSTKTPPRHQIRVETATSKSHHVGKSQQKKRPPSGMSGYVKRRCTARKKKAGRHMDAESGAQTSTEDERQTTEDPAMTKCMVSKQIKISSSGKGEGGDVSFLGALVQCI